MRLKNFLILGINLLLFNCSSKKEAKLPVLGRHEYVETKTGTDTIFHQISPFAFYNQDSALITNETYDGKIYVSDFFFTSCPSICPLMKVQMLRVYDKYKYNAEVGILSHTIDPEYDNIAVLKDYSERLGIDKGNWNFVTGIKDSIYHIAQSSYYIGVRDDGSFEHSGKFVLVDTKKHIRGVYDGIDEASVTKLLKDMEFLLEENKK